MTKIQNQGDQLKAIGNVVYAKKCALVKDLGITVEEWYKRSGVTPYVCNRVERGEPVSTENFVILLDALDIDLALDPKIGVNLSD